MIKRVLLLGSFLLFLVQCGRTNPDSAKSESNNPFQVQLTNQKEFSRNYSRGNDDPEEVDENNESNYETAQIRIGLNTGRDSENKIVVGISYHVILTTETGMESLKEFSFQLADQGTNLESPAKVTPVLLTQVRGACGLGVKNKYGAFAPVGSLTKDGKYEGKISVQLVPIQARENIVDRQFLHWTMEVIGGKVEKGTLSLEEKTPFGRRDGKELLRLVEKNDSGQDGVSQPFPTKKGATRTVR